MVEPNNDRFKYHYETTDAKKVSTAYISEDEVKKMSKVKDISLNALSAAGVLGFGTSFAIEVAEFIYGEQKAGRIEYWKATKKKNECCDWKHERCWRVVDGYCKVL